MAELHASKHGLATEIADAAGEFHDYALRRLSPRTYQVLREDTGAAYLVVLCGKTFTCDCPAFTFRNRADRKAHPGSCKHAAALAEIHPVLQAIRSTSA